MPLYPHIKSARQAPAEVRKLANEGVKGTEADTQEWLLTLDSSDPEPWYVLPEVQIVTETAALADDEDLFGTAVEGTDVPDSHLNRARQAALQYGTMDPLRQQSMAQSVTRGAPGLNAVPKHAARPQAQETPPSAGLMEELRKQTSMLTNMNLRINKLRSIASFKTI